MNHHWTKEGETWMIRCEVTKKNFTSYQGEICPFCGANALAEIEERKKEKAERIRLEQIEEEKAEKLKNANTLNNWIK
jgi:uncharacterized Zn finger protein (UPF0148 family)